MSPAVFAAQTIVNLAHKVLQGARHADCIGVRPTGPLFIRLYRRCPPILDAVTVVRPETVVRWHRMGFATYG
jgi:hypothetical protein